MNIKIQYIVKSEYNNMDNLLTQNEIESYLSLLLKTTGTIYIIEPMSPDKRDCYYIEFFRRITVKSFRNDSKT